MRARSHFQSTKSRQMVTPCHVTKWLPLKDMTLMRFKARRHVQVITIFLNLFLCYIDWSVIIMPNILEEWPGRAYYRYKALESQSYFYQSILIYAIAFITSLHHVIIIIIWPGALMILCLIYLWYDRNYLAFYPANFSTLSTLDKMLWFLYIIIKLTMTFDARWISSHFATMLLSRRRYHACHYAVIWIDAIMPSAPFRLMLCVTPAPGLQSPEPGHRHTTMQYNGPILLWCLHILIRRWINNTPACCQNAWASASLLKMTIMHTRHTPKSLANY